jgi:hypothetical protein
VELAVFEKADINPAVCASIGVFFDVITLSAEGFCNQLLELAPGQIFDCADVALSVQSQAFLAAAKPGIECG